MKHLSMPVVALDGMGSLDSGHSLTSLGMTEK